MDMTEVAETLKLFLNNDSHTRYTCFCPQYRFRCGETYGSLTHKLLADIAINSHHAKRSIEANKVKDSYEVIRPSEDDISAVNSRIKRYNTLYKHPMVSGYTGSVPNLNGRVDQRYSVTTTEGLVEFERKQLKSRAA